MQLSISQQGAQTIVSGLCDKMWLEKELCLIEKHEINWMTLCDDAYPELLKHIHLPPPLLYWRGEPLKNNQRKIAIVGARKADRYGQQAIDRIVPELVVNDFTITSGGALGADSMAHRAALDADGKTIVVLGSGLLRLYPRENKKLFDRIIEHGGTVLSAFPLCTDPYPANFPARNRIIAGLSDGVIVVQAARKSGARITAQYALEQGRDVFAVPGHIDNELSDGCHALVQEGAKLITGPHDILSEYGIEVSSERTATTSQVRQEKSKHVFEPKDPIQKIIIRACVQAQSIDELAVKTELDLQELQAQLFDLQVAGVIEQDFSGMWRMV